MGDLQNKLLSQFGQQDLYKRAAAAGQDYLGAIADRAVFPDETALANLDFFETDLPNDIGDAHDILEQLITYGSPATIAQLGGRYFGFVNGSVLPVAHAARLLADHWDQNAALTVMSPIVGKLESVAERWLCDLFNLPAGSVAGFVSGSSLAIQSGLAAGRWRLYQNMGWDVNARGLYDAPKLRIICSGHIHGTVTKMVALLGFGQDQIETVRVDDQGRICVDAVPDMDDHSLLILQAGNVTSGAFDDFASLIPRAKAAGAWVHVDGAFGLWAGVCDRLAHLTDGAHGADSFSIDGHKTLNTPYDCGITLCRDAQALRNALHSTGGYLQRDAQRDGMFLTPEMSRRARGVEIWAALNYLGRAGLDELVGQLHDRARRAAAALNAAGFSVLNDVVFNQVIVDWPDGDNAALMRSIQLSGDCWVGPGQWFGKPIIRFSVCSWASTDDDIDRAVGAFVAARNAIGGV